MLSAVALLLWLAASSHAGDVPSASEKPFKVAVVGAGIGGCASAYYLKFPDGSGDGDGRSMQPSLPIEVTGYDSSQHGPGGRVQSRTYPIADTADGAAASLGVDLGASIFVTANQRLVKLTEHFQLNVTRRPMSDFRMAESSALWDGAAVLWRLDEYSWYNPYGWWQRLYLGWRYGFSTMSQMRTHVSGFIERFGQVYTPQISGWRTVHELAARLNMTELLHQTAYDYLVDEVGLNALFVDEIVNAATRVNYGINVREIHALAGLVSLAPTISEVLAVEGGNQQLVKELCQRGLDQGHFGRRVVSIEPALGDSAALNCLQTGHHATGTQRQQLLQREYVHDIPSNGCRHRWNIITDGGHIDTYDAVILAAPLDRANLDESAYAFDVAPVKYKRLHVTMLSGQLRRAYFDDISVPVASSVMTHGANAPEFISITQLALAKTSISDASSDPPVLVKLFSDAELTDYLLGRLFITYDPASVQHTLFHSYPLMTPENAAADRRVEIAPGVWYVNGMEPFISTMETETVSAANIASLVQQWAAHVIAGRQS